MTSTLLRLLPIALLGVGLAGCGGAGGVSRSTSSGSTVVVEHVLKVSRELGPIDEDDYPVLDLGHAAKGADLHKIRTLLKRYYAAAAAEDGHAACSMMFSVAAKEVVEEEDDWYVHGNTCPVVMTQIFSRRHRQLVTDLKSLKAVRIRIAGPTGRVVLRFAKFADARVLDLRSVGRNWTVQYPIDTPMP
jgi:hypothetical protein